ncbi:MAG: hypothetical protein CMA59_00275 [Euryarchaeota archaeon]|jgi:hypothetical protein|nr:hypothetical protein [Euryarchaeota archaeon]|tara:strand:+ start:12 stop:260 length:249 start_codon:yes stop_codon:yes gene_type:complete
MTKEFKEKFMTQAKFSTMVEEVVKNSEGLVNYIDAVIVVCDELDIEVDTVNKLISKPLKDKIKFNAQELNYVKRTSRGVLPI